MNNSINNKVTIRHYSSKKLYLTNTRNLYQTEKQRHFFLNYRASLSCFELIDCCIGTTILVFFY